MASVTIPLRTWQAYSQRRTLSDEFFLGNSYRRKYSRPTRNPGAPPMILCPEQIR